MSETQAEHQLVQQIIQAVDSGKSLSDEAKRHALDVLESYECWTPFLKLIHKNLSSASSRRLEDYIRLARVQINYLEDVFSAADTCVQAVAQLKMSYGSFIHDFLPYIVEAEEWKTEATIVESVAKKFTENTDQVSALERLCLLYEKKIFNESNLNESYSRLLALDELNVKALRYFKLLFTQNYEWDKVVSILQSLLKASRHPQDIFRVAQELAAVYLYQLDNPQEAIDILYQYCEGSPLDASTINYDAYQRLGDSEGCIKVLRECLLSVDDDGSRAVLHFKIAKLEEKLNDLTKATQDYEKAIGLWPKFLEPYENLIYIAMQNKDWTQFRHWMNLLREQVTDKGLQFQMIDVVDRLSEGLGAHQSDESK